MNLEKYYENLSIFHIGSEPNRSFYIPCSSTQQFGILDMKKQSDKVIMLNGEWDFCLFNSIELVPNEIIYKDFWKNNKEKLL